MKSGVGRLFKFITVKDRIIANLLSFLKNFCIMRVLEVKTCIVK